MRLPALLLLSSSLLACRGAPAPPDALEPPFAVRPQVLPDTSTAPAGDVEVEAGLAGDLDDEGLVPVGVNLGLGPATEGFVAGDPYVEAGDGGQGPGDVVLGLRHRLREATAGRPALAVQLEGKLPTADEDEGLGTGELDLGLAALATWTRPDGWTWTGYRAGFLGEAAGEGIDLEHTLSLGTGQRLRPRLGVFGEAAWTTAPEQRRDEGVLQAGLALAPAEHWVLDVGVAFGLGDDAAPDMLFLGLTRAFPGVLGGRRRTVGER